MRRLTCPFNIDEKRGEADSGALPATLPAIAKSSQRQHRNPHRPGRFAQPADTQRMAVGSLRSGIKDRPEDGEIGAFVFGGAQVRERVRRDSDAEARGYRRAPHARRRRVRRQMHPVSAACQRDIHARVDQDARPAPVRQRQNAPHQAAQFARRKILFPNLDQVDAVRNGARDMRQQRVHPAGGQAAGNVVAQHYTGV